MCEGLDTKAIALKKALNESLANANSQTREILKEALDNLDISIEDTPITEAEDNIPWSEDEDILVEDTDSDEDIASEEVEEEEADEAEIPAEDTEDESEAESEEVETENTESNEEVNVGTVGELIAQLQDFEEDAPVAFNSIIVADGEYIVDGIDIESNDDSVYINLSYSQVIGDNTDEIEQIEDDSSEEDAVEAAEEEVPEEIPDTTEEAGDAGEEEVMESFKELVRQKDLLEEELKALKSAKTVGDAEVKELKESLEQYKLAFARTSEVAGKAKAFEKQIKQLQEQLSQKDVELSNLQKSHSSKLVESVDENNRKIADMKKQFAAKEAE